MKTVYFLTKKNTAVTNRNLYRTKPKFDRNKI